MKKSTRNVMMIFLLLIFVILLFLIGILILKQYQNKQIGELEKEINVLEEKKKKVQYEREEFQIKRDEMKEKVGNTDEIQEGEQFSLDENGVVSGNMNTVRESIISNVSDRINVGENWQVCVLRLSDGAEEIVGSGKMIAASLIKLYIMGAVYEDYDTIASQNGKESVDNLLRAMITISDNDAANALTRMLGQGDATVGRSVVNDYCNRNGYVDSNMGRMLLETGTDCENYTSAKDCVMFLKDIYQGKVSYGEDMMNLLKQQERRGKIPAGVPEGVIVANKTGELDYVENDAAVVFRDNCPYILCVMSENVENASVARQTIVNISSDVYSSIVK